MKNHSYYNPTKIIFGKDAESKLGSEIKKHAKKVLLHYGGGSIKASGLYDRIIASLNEAGLEYVELGGVLPNPRISLARKGIEMVKEHGVDFILAVGGGSVIDSAKAIAAGAFYDGDVWDLYLRKGTATKFLPLATVLTIPAAGSEASESSVMTDEENLLKRDIGYAQLRPVFSILNPELTFTLPEYQTACGLADMFAHVMERYFVSADHMDMTDRLCEATMKGIITNGRRLMKDPNNYDLRAEIMQAGYIAHNGTLDMGRGGDWSSHQLEHELSGFYDIAHGAGLAIIIPAWMKHVYKNDVARFAQFGNRVFDLEVNTYDLEETALKAIAEVEQFFKDLNLPTRFADAKLPTHQIKEMAASLFDTSDKVIGNFQKINRDQAIEIYNAAV
ncbi:MAG: iron-containing alcohol dehydrogenase [Turicibacter sp.]|nr:iron-containing alcohol dehydrogenase [Turicibacter sp.]